MRQKDPVLGILGGLGPIATVELEYQITNRIDADFDQEHIEMIVYNDPKIPDRQNAILDNGDDPIPRLIRNAKILEEAGADYLVMASNTTHYYYDSIQQVLSIPFLNMLEITGNTIRSQNHKNVGIITTTSARQVNLFERYIDDDVSIIYPSDKQKIMSTIYSIKSGELDGGTTAITEVAERLVERGAHSIVVGCTELSMLSWPVDLPTIDPVDELVDKICEIHVGPDGG